MADPCKVEGCVQRTDRLEKSLCVQKDEYEERLRLQKEEYEERLRLQKEECEERLRVQKEDLETAFLAQRDAIIESCYPGYYPLPLEDFPLEIIALIADFVHDFDDLANMALASRRVHNGVLLSRQWIVVEEIVAATRGNAIEDQKIYLHSRKACARYACEKGLLRCLRAMNLSRDEVTSDGCLLGVHGAGQYGQLDVLKYLHTTYALTAREFSTEPGKRPMDYARHLPVLKYLHSVMGFAITPGFPLYNVAHCLESLKFIHSDVDFIANRYRSVDRDLVRIAAHLTPGLAACSGVSCGDCGACARERLVYLRDEYGIAKGDARHWPAIRHGSGSRAKEIIREVFDLEE